ncbi:guanylate kinase [Salipaludibacillus daqingensis]|uniref:guanylate kinase n=1 Tax=Salipaludibacillus daqingensis TaxID=3041001 RepID=UPI002473D42D|nr:guanylate kinase [Salipaludibacillus daqingensis]
MYDLKEKERIFVFTGPDGSGRKTIAKLVAQTTLHMKGIISYTTRKRRPYETDHQDYHFISEDEFETVKNNGEFLESVHINGNSYGIKEKDVRETFEEKGCIYLVLNPEGSDIVKKLYGDKVIRLFVYADRDTVLARQKERGDSDEIIDLHLSHYDEDIAYKEKCEHAFENYKLDHTAYEITNTVEEYLDLKLAEDD